jgi:hypothetical protein
MRKTKLFSTIGIVIVTGAIIFTFNNCSSDVEFSDVPDYNLDLSSEEEFLNNLPPEELDQQRPLSDLADNPALYEIYKCPDSSGVVICHFPENVQSQATQCVGLPSVKTHYDHNRIYELNGVTKTISDYLGPCRFPL